jgi:uncharacterized protein YndB with AHSA1/START domain
MVELKHRVPISASPAKVYAAVVTTDGNRGWWTADSKVDSRVGGEAEFGFDRRGMVFRMTVDKLTPNQEVVMSCHGDHPEWNGTTLTWIVEKQGNESALTFTHSGWKSMTEFCASCNSMWGQLMFRLKGFVEGNNPGPQWTE